MEDLMIKIDNVSKEYKLGQINGTTLRDEIQRHVAKMRGKEDPTSKIGDVTNMNGETFMALDGVSFEVKKGERVGLIGHNGAGKSTLLKLISRITAPTNGFIGLNGRVASMLEVGTGFRAELTGRENIYMNGAILGMTKREIDAKIEDIIEFSECRQFIDTPVKRYSSGMHVKLAFSVAAHLDSEILIMDEVLAVGDMTFQKKCLNKMNDVSRQDGRTILYVSHNMNTIRQLCDRVVVLNRGKVLFDGAVEAGIEQYIGCVGSMDVKYRYDSDSVDSRGNKSVELIGLDVLDTDIPRYQRGENIHFIVHCKANKDCNEVGLRFELLAGGSVVGTAFYERTFSCKKNDCIDLDLELSTENFVPSRYIVKALLYENGQFSRQVNFHRIEPAMIFEVIDESLDAIIWNSSKWGYTRYNDIVDYKI